MCKYANEMIITPRASSDQRKPVARGNGFQLSGNNTSREEQEISNEFSVNMLQTWAEIIS